MMNMMVMFASMIFYFLASDTGCAFAFPNPLHASCKLDWHVGVDCNTAADKLIKQMNLWKGDDCNNGEKCLYTYESFDGKTLLAKHTTPKAHYVDDLKIVFSSNGNECNIHGESKSELWYAILDYGTNYCNLHNLITGSGLSETENFSESTNNLKCTQYSSANCDKY